MARFHPQESANGLRHIFKVYRWLNKVLDEAFEVWQRTESHAETTPCFTVFDPDGRPAFVRIGLAQVCLQEFVRLDKWLLEDVLELEQQDELHQVPRLWLFPNREPDDLQLPARRQIYIGKAGLEACKTFLTQLQGPPLNPERKTWLLERITLETSPPVQLRKEPQSEHLDLSQLRKLLDFDQKKASEMDLQLIGREARLARNFGLKLITGIAGSGKSLVLLHRLRQLRESWPDRSALVLIHNRPILLEMERRYLQLSGGDTGVIWKTFMGWCVGLSGPINPIKSADRLKLVEQICRERFSDTNISAEMLLDEIGFIKDRLLFTLEDYLDADRTGRGFGLDQDGRKRVFQALITYQSTLHERRQIDWWDVPRIVWERYRSSEMTPYDFIMVDEAQFFAPIWFELVKKSLANNGLLFLTADPAQGFLGRRQTWLAAGLDIKGRSKHLNRSYRTTRAILKTALAFNELRLGEDSNQRDIDMTATEKGELPVALAFANELDEMSWLFDSLAFFEDENMPHRDILVLVPTKKYKDRFARFHQQRYGETKTFSDLQDSGEKDPDDLWICNLKAATGLEAALVFVLGLQELFDPENNPLLSEEEREDLIEVNTRLVYMAMTRAAQRLVLLATGQIPQVIETAIVQAGQEDESEEKGLFDD